MKTINFTAAFALSAAIITAPVARADQATDAQAIYDQVLTMSAAMAQGDLPAVLASYAEGALVDFGAGGIVQGHDQIEAAYTQFMSMNPQVAFGAHKVLIAGNLALHVSDWTMQATTADGKPFSDGGLSVVLFRRGADDTWRMVIDAPYAAQFGN